MKINWQQIKDYSEFEDLCGDIVRAFLPESRRGSYVKTSMNYRQDFQMDGLIKFGGFEYLSLESPIAISCKTTDWNADENRASNSIKNEFCGKNDKNIKRLLENSPKSIILFSSHNLIPSHKKILEEKVGIPIMFQGREEIEKSLYTHPHLLGKYFNRSISFKSCLSSDKNKIKEYLEHTNRLSKEIPFDKIEHPSIIDIKKEPKKHLKITGKAGAGKSVALYQILTSLPEIDVVFITSLSDSVMNNIKDVLLQEKPKLVFVIDNFHDLINIHGAGIFPELVQFANNLEHVGIYLAYRSNNIEEVDNMLNLTNWNNIDSKDVLLNNPPKSFLLKIVNLVCKEKKITIDNGIKEGFVDGIINWENTPACAVSVLLPYENTKLSKGFFPVSLKRRESKWKEAFQDLNFRKRNLEIDLLQSISILRECGKQKNSFKEVFEVFKKITNRVHHDFNIALNKVCKEGWIAINDEFISGHDMQIQAEVVDLFIQKQVTPRFNHFTELLIENQFDCLKKDRPSILFSISKLYWDMGAYKICEKINSQIIAEFPEENQALCNRGMCRIRLKRINEGISDLKKAVEKDQSKINFIDTLFYSLLRFYRNKEASILIENLLEQNRNNYKVLSFICNAFQELNEKEKLLSCANHLWKLKKNSLSAAILINALRLNGKSEKIKKVIKYSIPKWSEDSNLLIALAEYHRSRKDEIKALEYAEKATIFAPNNPYARIVYLWALIRNQNFNKAKTITKNSLDIFPNNPGIKAISGILSIRDNKTQEAIELLKFSFENREKIPPEIIENASLDLAEALIQDDNIDEAKHYYNFAIKNGVPQWFCKFRRAIAFSKKGNLSLSISLLKEAIKEKDAGIEPFFELVELLLEINDQKQALRVLNKAEKIFPDDEDIFDKKMRLFIKSSRYKEALSYCKKIIKLKASPDNYCSLGWCYRCLNKHNLAIKNYDIALSIDPNHFQSLLNKAGSYTKLKEWDKALTCFSKLKKLDKQFIDIPDEIICLSNVNKDEEAIKLLDLEISKEPDALLFYLKGNIFQKIKKYPDAIDNYNLATELLPNFIDAWKNKYKVQCLINDYKNAILSFKVIIKLEPNDSESIRNLAILHENNKNIGEAKKYYNESLKISNHPLTRHHYANFLLKIKEKEKAIEQIKLAVHSFGNNIESHELMIKVLIELNFTEGALCHMKENLELEPENPLVQFGCAIFLEQIQNINTAEKCLVKAINFDSENLLVYVNYIDLLASNKKHDIAMFTIDTLWKKLILNIEKNIAMLAYLTDKSLILEDVPRFIIYASKIYPYLEKSNKTLAQSLQKKLEILKKSFNEVALSNTNEYNKVALGFFNVGLISHILGRLKEARNFYRKSLKVPFEYRINEALLNWYNIILKQSEQDNIIISQKEIKEGLSICNELIKSNMDNEELDEYKQKVIYLEKLLK